jgi:hypothetical protein
MQIYFRFRAHFLYEINQPPRIIANRGGILIREDGFRYRRARPTCISEARIGSA